MRSQLNTFSSTAGATLLEQFLSSSLTVGASFGKSTSQMMNIFSVAFFLNQEVNHLRAFHDLIK